jgi:tetratricopeptide (TPR) repeat protein
MIQKATVEQNRAGRPIPRIGNLFFWIACALVIGGFACTAKTAIRQLSQHSAQNSYYNLLVRGFQAGQLNLKKDAPPQLAQLSDPYNPALNAPYVNDFIDTSYYKGKLYLYYGVVPVVVLLWPYAALTGHYLSDKAAVIIFFSVGFLTAAWVLREAWRRYFLETDLSKLVVGVLALGAAIGCVEAESLWCDIYEVAETCAFAFTMVALAGIWGALHDTRRQIRWMILASLAYGLAIGSRPTLLFGAIILLGPAVWAWHKASDPNSRRRAYLLLVAAIIPIMLIGCGLMLYNLMRFDNPFEFGIHYVLQSVFNAKTAPQISLHYTSYNLRYYFWEPLKWTGHFPFLQTAQVSRPPSGYEAQDKYYGGIMFISIMGWMALATPLLWKKNAGGQLAPLRCFAAALSLLFVTCAFTICLFFSATTRYELDFAPALWMLAIIAAFCLGHATPSAIGSRAVRGTCYLLLSGSIALSLLVSIKAHADANYYIANAFVRYGRLDEAISYFQKAFTLESRSADSHAGLGTAYYLKNQLDEAISQYQIAFEIQPDFAEAVAAHNNLAYCFLKKGQINEAIVQFQKVLEIKPDFAEAHDSLGDCFFQAGRMNEAIAQYQQALKIKPDFAEAHNNLGYSLFLTGQPKEAIFQFQKALDIKPDFAEARYNLGYSFLQSGQVDDAIVQFQKAIELQPRFAQAYKSLGDAFGRKGMTAQAAASYQKAAELSTDSSKSK